VPVLIESPLACGLLGSFVSAASGGALYRKASFLVDALGTQVFSPELDIIEEPHRPGEVGSTPFDDEGVFTRPRTVVDGGVLQGWFLSTYSARKLGMKTTGNAGGAHGLRLTSRRTQAQDDLRAMLRKQHAVYRLRAKIPMCVCVRARNYANNLPPHSTTPSPPSDERLRRKVPP
jgi:PmbA protein